MEYVAPVNGDANDPTRPYQDGDPSFGQVGSIPSARFFNLLMNEGRNLVEGAGLTLDPQDDAQWLTAVAAVAATASGRVVKRDSVTQANIHTTTSTTLVTVDNCDFEYSAVDGSNPRLVEAYMSARTGDDTQGGNLTYYELEYFDKTAGSWVRIDLKRHGVSIQGVTDVLLTTGLTLRAWHEVDDATPRYRLAHRVTGSGSETSTVYEANLSVTEFSI